MSAPSKRISALEWVVAGAGLACVVATLAFLVIDARADGAREPRILVRTDSLVRTAEGVRVHFTARNDGRDAGAEVSVAGTMTPGGAPSRVSLDFLPGRSERRGTLLFAPGSAGVPRLSVESYREP